jgi:H2-forming N5,N10-methylenetetrahydromethanopterin dehydrogenase-like enzyme
MEKPKMEQMKMRVEERGMDQVSDDVYTSSVSGVEKLVLPFGETFKIRFKIEGGPNNGKEVSGLCKAALNPQTKLYGWLKQMNVVLNTGVEIDINSIVGKKCRVLVKNKQRDSPTGEKLQFPNVSEVLPL